MAQHNRMRPSFSRAASDALSTHWKQGQGKARPALGMPGLGTCDVAPDEGLHEASQGGVMWTNSGGQGRAWGQNRGLCI